MGFSLTVAWESDRATVQRAMCCDNSLRRIGFELQDQPYDHVLKDEERSDFQNVCDYIARNPERAGLMKADEFASYPFSGCLIPGYPELKPFECNYWDEFDKIISYLKKDGLMQAAASKDES